MHFKISRYVPPIGPENEDVLCFEIRTRDSAVGVFVPCMCEMCMVVVWRGNSCHMQFCST